MTAKRTPSHITLSVSDWEFYVIRNALIHYQEYGLPKTSYTAKWIGTIRAFLGRVIDLPRNGSIQTERYVSGAQGTADTYQNHGYPVAREFHWPQP